MSANRRIQDMLLAIKDVAPSSHPHPIDMNSASPKHKELFSKYVATFREAKREADSWLQGIVDGIVEDSGEDRATAERAVQLDNPMGSATHGEVIGVIRRYWLECAALNARDPNHRVPPEQLVLGWLADSNDGELQEFAIAISKLTYLPVGLDKDGNWV